MIDYIHLLRAHDHATHAEQPPGFNRTAAEIEFVRMAEEIVIAFPDSSFETGTKIQDAAFHGQIYVKAGGAFTLVRVSNFGRFVTFFGDDDSCPSPEMRDALLAIFASHGYTFIPPDVLATPYDGPNRGVSGFPDWGYRFFEWI